MNKQDEDSLVISGEPIFYLQALSPEFKNLKLAPISDVHFGNPLFSERHLDRTLEFIAGNDNVYTILNGDLCEAVIKSSKGEIYNQKVTPQGQRDWIIKKFTPIKHKILGSTMGNHELRIWNEVGIDICKDIAEALEIPYRAAGIMIKVTFGDGNKGVKGRPYSYFIEATHGYGGARTKSAKAVKVERLANWIHADVYFMSHDHVVNVAPDVYLMPDNRTHLDKKTGFTVGKVKECRKMLVKTNAYLKWGGYSEMGGFPPTDLATPTVTLAGEGKPRVSVEI